jgi:predicted acyl esterase
VFVSDICVDHDVEFETRDGKRLYADFYRPPKGLSKKKLPVIIISWPVALWQEA